MVKKKRRERLADQPLEDFLRADKKRWERMADLYLQDFLRIARAKIKNYDDARDIVMPLLQRLACKKESDSRDYCYRSLYNAITDHRKAKKELELEYEVVPDEARGSLAWDENDETSQNIEEETERDIEDEAERGVDEPRRGDDDSERSFYGTTPLSEFIGRNNTEKIKRDTWKAIDQLPGILFQTARAHLNAKELGWKNKDAAEHLGISQSAFADRMRRVRTALEPIFRAMGYPEMKDF